MLDYNNAHQNADVLATGGYFMGRLGYSEYETTIATMTVDDIFTEINNGGVVAPGSQSALAQINDIYTNQFSLANARGLRLVAYEGGQHLRPSIFSGDNDNEEDGDNQNIIYNKFLAANRDSRMKTAYITNFTNWKNAGGHEFFHFNNLDFNNVYGIFGALEYQTQSRVDAPKYDAIMTFMEDSPCWWDNCGRSISGGGSKKTPIITRFSPKSGKGGTLVSIVGKNFSPEKNRNVVKFGKEKATVVSVDKKGTLLMAMAPKNVKTDYISITVAGKTATSAAKFVVKP